MDFLELMKELEFWGTLTLIDLILIILIFLIAIFAVIVIVNLSRRMRDLEEDIEKIRFYTRQAYEDRKEEKKEIENTLSTITDKRLYMIEGYLKDIAKNTTESK